MPLTTCPDCETSVSTRAAACPKCGAPMADTAAGVTPQASESLHTKAVHKGSQSSTLKQHLGQAFAFVGICIAVVVGMATSFQAGAITAVVLVGVGCLIAYT